MEINRVIKYLDDWLPEATAWTDDNIGLQVGNPQNHLSNILLALELDNKVLKQAIKKKANLIITHHPFIFTPLKNLNFQTNPKAQIIKELIENDITLYSAHTNLDYVKGGVSFELAEQIKLRNINFLNHQKSNQYKIVVFLPEHSVKVVSDAIFNAGGGIIGEYSECSTINSVTGTFKGSSLSKPTVGRANNFEKVDEVRLEILVDAWKLDNVVESMKLAHPYEEPAYDIVVLKNKNSNYGAGAIGEFEKPMNVKEFLAHIKESLKANGLKYTHGNKSKIKNVAVCGGSCSDLISSAISANADAFITSDIKYHTFQDAENRIMLVDAGHYETEVPVLNVLKRKLDILLQGNKIKVFKYSGSTNPIKFYNK